MAGSGFPLGSYVQIVQCLAGADPVVFPRACASATNTAFLEGTDSFSGLQRLVKRYVPDVDGTEVDCAESAGTCEMVAYSYEDPYALGRVPLDFDPNAPPVPDPTMKVRPKRNLRGGQEVTVTGNGWSPHAWIGITECEEGATDVNGCDLSTVTYADADENGDFTATFVVRGKIRVGGELIRCKAHEGACLVGVGNVNDLEGEKAAKPIGFRER